MYNLLFCRRKGRKVRLFIYCYFIFIRKMKRSPSLRRKMKRKKLNHISRLVWRSRVVKLSKRRSVRKEGWYIYRISLMDSMRLVSSIFSRSIWINLYNENVSPKKTRHDEQVVYLQKNTVPTPYIFISWLSTIIACSHNVIGTNSVNFTFIIFGGSIGPQM